MDRGIPTEEVLEQMRQADPPVSYLVGTPRGRLHQLEKDFLARSWEQVREEVEGKLLPQEQEIYVLARSRGRVAKERGMRRQRLKKLWKRLGVLQRQKLTRDVLWLKLGAAKQEAGQAYRLAEIRLPGKNEPVSADTFTFSLHREKLRLVRVPGRRRRSGLRGRLLGIMVGGHLKHRPTTRFRPLREGHEIIRLGAWFKGENIGGRQLPRGRVF